MLKIFEEALDDFKADYENVEDVAPGHLDWLAEVSMTSFNMNDNFMSGKN